MSTNVAIIAVVFAFLNMLYATYMQENYDFINDLSEASIKIMLLSFVLWIFMAYSVKNFVIDDKKTDFISILTNATILGMVTYGAMNLVLMTFEPEWTTNIATTDILYGITSFIIVSFVALSLKPFLGE